MLLKIKNNSAFNKISHLLELPNDKDSHQNVHNIYKYYF